MVEKRGDLRQVPLDSIQVPELRVTSEVDPDLMAELQESISRQGILQPLQVEEVDGKLWLIDGLHRLMVARRLRWETVPCIVTPGSQDDVLLKNLVVNRQRGKSNPAHEGSVIKALREQGGYPLERIAEITGLSVGWTRKLNDIADLPPGVLSLVGESRLGVSHALELVRLRDDALQMEVAQQAVEWRYTVEQVRFRVEALLQPAAAPKPGGVQFSETGAPSRVPIPCALCHTDLTGNVSYLYLCGDCQRFALEVWEEVKRQEAAAHQPPAPAPSPIAESATPQTA